MSSSRYWTWDAPAIGDGVEAVVRAGERSGDGAGGVGIAAETDRGDDRFLERVGLKERPEAALNVSSTNPPDLISSRLAVAGHARSRREPRRFRCPSDDALDGIGESMRRRAARRSPDRPRPTAQVQSGLACVMRETSIETSRSRSGSVRNRMATGAQRMMAPLPAESRGPRLMCACSPASSQGTPRARRSRASRVVLPMSLGSELRQARKRAARSSMLPSGKRNQRAGDIERHLGVVGDLAREEIAASRRR